MTVLRHALGAVALIAAVGSVEFGVREPSAAGVAVAVPPTAAPAVDALRSAPLTAIESPRAAAIASGVVFGRTEHVSAADEAAFLDAGLWHLLSGSQMDSIRCRYRG